MDLNTTSHVVGEDGVAWVWLDRPARHNAWTGRMHAEVRWIFAGLHDDPAVRVALLTGRGTAFCVGGDARALVGHAERAG